MLYRQENQNVEFKESWRDEYLKWICGFANASGGKIYIGVDDNGNVVGITKAKKLLEEIPNKVRDILGIIVDVNLKKDNDKEYLEVVRPFKLAYLKISFLFIITVNFLRIGLLR